MLAEAIQERGDTVAEHRRDGFRRHVEAAIELACNRVAPLWPLRHFIAVNPLLGFADERFEGACRTLRRVAQVDILAPRACYRAALASGLIEDRDLRAALADAPEGVPTTPPLLRAAALATPAAACAHGRVATVAQVLDRLARSERVMSRVAFMIDEISRWCAAWFDRAQAAWRPPTGERGFYAAWRAAMRHDLNAEAMGVRGFRGVVAAMADEPISAIVQVVEGLGVPAAAVGDYLYRALFDIAGWAGYARHLVWTKALSGEDDDILVQVLAVRVVWGYALYCAREDRAFRDAWTAAMAEAVGPSDGSAPDPDLAVDLVLHEAFENAHRRRLFGQLSVPGGRPPLHKRPAIQAVFCIDVRSEVFRRALEIACPDAETLGFAGFFGLPLEYVPIGAIKGEAQCPVLLKPVISVREGVIGGSGDEQASVLRLRRLRRRAAKAWKSFKLAAVACFTYVETVGLAFFLKLASDSLALSRTVPDPRFDGIDRGVRPRIGPVLASARFDGDDARDDPDVRLATAEAILRGLSLTERFAPTVLLVGHGATTVNNPHGSGLDCGACAGHTGEANARVAAAVLNDPRVREGLRRRGLDIPVDTLFVAALHDTTTDAVRLFETAGLAAKTLQDLRTGLARAGGIARRERAHKLGVAGGGDVDGRIVARAHDWSQVRPEWGLAGCEAFIAAPRWMTAGSDLGGRVFLHDYAWRSDEGLATLTLIMSAPMVVANWISLQYFTSTTNNAVFGAGDKTLHNVVGGVGVLEGNAGDLKVGLPWQSVRDGRGRGHDPIRLTVLIAAPTPAINAVIGAHETVRHLVDNAWLHLFTLGDDGRVSARYRGRLRWEAMR